jgi:hypothetical protein
MKTLDVPQIGKRGNTVASRNHYGPHQRKHASPNKRRTGAQFQARRGFARVSGSFADLTDEQRHAWDIAASQVKSKAVFGRSWPLTGQNFYQKINTARTALGLEPLLLPPAPVSFGASPVGPLTIANDVDGLALKLSIANVPAEDIAVYASPPCSRGRRRCWDLRLLGLLPTPDRGASDITTLYLIKYGKPSAGQRIFIASRQHLNGWQSQPALTSAVVPARKPLAPARKPRQPSRPSYHV